MELNIESKRLLSNIFVKSTMSVIQDKKASTAFIDLESNLIVIPAWEHLDPETLLFLISHECSHAIFTPVKDWVDNAKNHENPNLFKNIMNIVEDHRIDTLMNRKYPGTKKWYFKGIKNIENNGFFSKVDSFMGKLNYQLKAGRLYSVNIDFDNQEEEDLCKESRQCETFEDVLEISEKIFKYLKDNNLEDKQNINNGGISVSSSEIFDKISNEKLKELLTEGVSVSDAMSNSDSISNKKSAYNKNKNIDKKYGIYVLREKLREIDFESLTAGNMYARCKTDTKTVNKLNSEFMRIRSIKKHQNMGLIDEGTLNPNRLWAHTLTDDIFNQRILQRTVDSDHHALIMIDMSSSMCNVFSDLVDGLSTILEFLRKSNVKYCVKGFTGHSIVNILDNDRLPSMRKKMNSLKGNNYFMSTPLTSAIFHGINYLEKIQSQKKSFVLLTDGGCTEHIVERGIMDPKTKLVEYDMNSNVAALRHMKNRMDVGVTHIFIGGNDYIAENEKGADVYIEYNVNKGLSNREFVRKFVGVINNEVRGN